MQRMERLGALIEILENDRERDDSDGSVSYFNETIDPRQNITTRLIIRTGEILYLETLRYLSGIVSIYYNSGRPFPRAD